MLDISVDPDSGREGVAVMRLEGELDAATYLEVIEHARLLAKAGTRRLVIDLGGLTYMGSSGLFAIHSAAIVLQGDEPPDPEAGWGAVHSAEGRDATPTVKLLDPQPQVARVLERSGLTRFFDTYTDRAEAISSF